MHVSEHTTRKARKGLLVATLLCLGGLWPVFSQVPAKTDSLKTGTASGRGNGNVIITTDDSLKNVQAEAKPEDNKPPTKDNAPIFRPVPKYDYKNHSPVKATWMSAALPSLGQFYNRRYWKPPIIYAGLGVSIYFLIDNQLKYIVARNSYRARVGISGFSVDPKYATYDKEQILSDRDFYRTSRDYSIIAVAAIYALNIIDAAVDAHLRTFDVGDDLSMKIRPTFQFNSYTPQNGFAPTAGIAWVVKFR